jgi:MFS superfamily sulfate permease-like transporter
MEQFKQYLRSDVSAGLVVFLVALPLCLGIALASGAPLFAGILAGIVGGTVVALLSGSEVSVSGPAAGLAVIVATAIQQLGSFPVFQTAIVLAGVMQLVFGAMRFGSVANYVPSSVLKGMLAGIGLVILLKQIPHAVGRDNDYEGDFSFFEKAGDNTFTDIIKALYASNWEAILISGSCLALLLVWDSRWMKEFRFTKIFPGALAAVILGTAMNEGFRAMFPDFYLRAEDGHLVSLPVINGFSGFVGLFSFPEFSALMRQDVWITAITIAVVASLETLLSLEAADKLDPYKRVSSPNRELFAQGTGNFCSGLIGGLPITSVVVRTSANIYAGGRTRMSAFFHGLLLLVAVLAIPYWLNRVPLSCLAAILMLVGYKLSNPKLFKRMWAAGYAQFLPFVVTVAGVVLIDLLKGVLLGLAVGLFFVLRSNHHQAVTVVNDDNLYLLRFNKDMSFLNKADLKFRLSAIPDGAHLLIDGHNATFVDTDIDDVIADFLENARHRRIKVELKKTNGSARNISAPQAVVSKG